MTDSAFSNIVQKWAIYSELFLPDQDRSTGRYVFHKSNECGECFQIVIFPPNNKIVVIEVWSLETRDDRERHFRWDVHVTNLLQTLNLALEKVNAELRI